MKRLACLIVILLYYPINSYSQSETGTLVDSRDGQVYETVKIGNQWWMAENLGYLPAVSPPSDNSISLPLYYVYGYEGTSTSAAKATSNYNTYGVLYNWPAAMNGESSSNSNPSGVQGVCPSGWHLPSDNEFYEFLDDELGGWYEAGGKLKEAETLHWQSPNTGATNETGFTALPGGFREVTTGEFYGIGVVGMWWSSSEHISSGAYRVGMNNTDTQAGVSNYNKNGGLSVRCVKNVSNSPPNKPILISPQNGAEATGPFNLVWDCYDPDGDILDFTIYIRNNEEVGGEWESLDVGSATSQEVPASDNVEDITVEWYVDASDGITNTASDVWQFIYKGYECTPTLVSPVVGAVLDNGCKDNSDLLTWNFDWEDCEGATQYHIYLNHPDLENPLLNHWVEQSSYSINSVAFYENPFLSGWTWRVRAMVNGFWCPWSEERTFNVEPVNTDCPENNPPNIPILITPQNGSEVSTPFTLTWSCTDPDGDPLNYTVYEREKGLSWDSEYNGSATSYEVPSSDNIIDIDYEWYVVASDGSNSSTSDVWQFTIKGLGTDCAPSLISPTVGALLDNGCSDQSDYIEWDFDWADCVGATEYNVRITWPGSGISSDEYTTDSELSLKWIAYIIESNRFGHKWKVRAMVNGAWGPWSAERTFDVEPLDTDCATECTPTLVSPSNGAELDNGCSDQSDLETWEFDWQECEQATKYHLYVKHPDKAIPTIDNNNITVSQYSSNAYSFEAVEFQQGWSWRVRAMVNGEWGPWSEERTFNVEIVNTDCPENNPPNLPTLISPQNGTEVTTPVTFTWSCIDPDGDQLNYTLYIREVGASWISVSVGTATSFEIASFEDGSDITYEWYVYATDGINGSSSYTRQFTIKEPSSECIPILASPVVGGVLDNGCTDNSNLLTWNFDWGDCEGATKYHLYIKHPDLSIPAINNDNITVSHFTRNAYSYEAAGFLNGWTWRVRAMVNGVWGPWSDERTFNLEQPNADCPASPPCTPTLISPLSGAILDNGCSNNSDFQTWNFDWQDCEGATLYHLYVKHPNITDPLIDNNNISNSNYSRNLKTVVNDKFSQGWIWRVRAMVNGAWGPWSDERTFSVEPLNTDCPELIKIDAKITEVTPSKLTITKGKETVSATITIKNTGNKITTYNVKASSITGTGSWYNWSPTNSKITIDPGSTSNVVLGWTPGTDVPVGNYGINVTVMESVSNKIITEKWTLRFFDVADDILNVTILNISLNKIQFAKNKDAIRATLSIKNISNKFGKYHINTSIENSSNSYSCNSMPNLNLDAHETSHVELNWLPTNDIINGQYQYVVTLTDATSTLELDQKSFKYPIKIFSYDADIKIENFILSSTDPELRSAYPIWTNDDNSAAKICADGSNSTLISFSDKSNSLDLPYIRFKVSGTQGSTNTDKFGYFKNRNVIDNSVIVEYQHPDYIDVGDKPFRPDTIIIYDNSQPNFIIHKIPIQIHRAPILYVHGLWGSEMSFHTMDEYLIDSNFYPEELSLRLDYEETVDRSFETNKDVVREGIDKLLNSMRADKFSAGKVDIIAHSMGGIITRKYIQSDQYLFRKDIHKLITLNSPHSGSQAANLLLDFTSPNLVFNAELNAKVNLIRDFLMLTGKNYLKGAVKDLKVDSKFFTEEEAVNSNTIPIHCIVSSFAETPFTDKFKQQEEDRHILSVLSSNFMNELYNNDSNDVIVPLTSQIAGIDKKSQFFGITHQTIREVDIVANKVGFLLSQSSNNTDYFTKKGFNPPLLEYSVFKIFKDTKSKNDAAETKCDSIMDNSIIVQSDFKREYNTQELLTFEINTKNTINRLLISIFNRDYLYSLDTLTSKGEFNFLIPNEIFDSLSLMIVGFNNECYIDDTLLCSYIIKNSDKLDSVSCYPSKIVIPENSYVSASICAYYSKGITRSIDNVFLKNIRFEIADTSLAKIDENINVFGQSIGYTTLYIYYNDKSLEVPIQVIPMDTSLYFEPTDTTNINDIKEMIASVTRSKFSIYPNPSNDIVTIRITKPEHSVLTIYTINGAKLFSKKLSDKDQNIDIAVSQFPKGIYFVSIYNEGYIITEKLLVK